VNNKNVNLKKILIIVGTRPEAIKMAPVFKVLKQSKLFSIVTLNSGQHDELIDDVFEVFDWEPDYSFKIHRNSEDITELYSILFKKINLMLKKVNPDLVIVHGDTATTAVASIVSFLHQIKIAHIEAGLRSFSRLEPWPEEVNRRITDIVTDIYFAPTESSKKNLLKEGAPADKVYVTGNTVVDALQYMLAKIDNDNKFRVQLEKKYSFLRKDKKMLLITGHRRENYGNNIKHIFSAIRRISEKLDCQIIFPAHPHPTLQKEIKLLLSGIENLYVLPPLNYLEFIYLMRKCDLIISDSGGIQEEAPTFGKKVLVTRNVTERYEGLKYGFLELVGCDEEKIVSRAMEILSKGPKKITHPNPYGDGKASISIRDVLIEIFDLDRNSTTMIHDINR
jgi:UDP-N-acetylglucosamine 2-epimerase (non-hydrolysing)